MPEEKPKECPKCKSTKVKKIIYGYIRPTLWSVVFGRSFVGGGCVVREDSPAWYCSKCKNHWGKYSNLH